jgi:hypothetical protein
VRIRVPVRVAKAQIRLTRANVVAAAVSAVALVGGVAVSVRVNAETSTIHAQTTSIDEQRDHLREWQAIAPTILHNEARARAAIAPFCALSPDLNGALLRVASRVSAPHVRVASGDYLVAAIPATPASTQLAGPTAPPSPAPAVVGPTSSTQPQVSDGIAEIAKPLTVNGPYPSVIRALAAIDGLHYPVSLSVDHIGRKSETDVDVAVTLTLRVPTADVCQPATVSLRTP